LQKLRRRWRARLRPLIAYRRATKAICRLSTEIVAFSPALGYASIIEPATRLVD
jgi:hypothetical protein